MLNSYLVECQRTLQDHLDGGPDRQVISSPRSNKTLAIPTAAPIAGTRARAAVSQSTDQRTRYCRSDYGVNVGINLVDGLQCTLTIHAPLPRRTGQALQIAHDRKDVIVGKNQLSEPNSHTGAAFDSSRSPFLFHNSPDAGMLRDHYPIHFNYWKRSFQVNRRSSRSRCRMQGTGHCHDQMRAFGDGEGSLLEWTVSFWLGEAKVKRDSEG